MRKQLTLLTILIMLAFSPLPAHAQDSTACADDVFVAPGDTLSVIAARTLGSIATYPAIVAATNRRAVDDASYAVIDNPAAISVGWKLCIPVATQQLDAPASADEAPTAQAAPTAIPTPAPLPGIVKLAPGELHPLAIERMRKEDYPGSELVVEQVLAPGVNYDRSIVSYDSEGNKNFALLTVPQGETPETGWPVVIFNHGFIRPEIYRTTERYIAYVDGFARNGYIVLRPDYRGHGFSEGEATGGYGTPAYTVDVLNAVAAIKQHPEADPERMGMWGHSMGGHITLRAMVTTGDIKAGVIWAGVVASYPDIIYNWHRGDRYPIPASVVQRARRWRTELIEAYGEPEDNPEFWASISPIAFVGDLSGPIQLHHGTNDASVPPDFSATLADEIEAVGGEVEYYVYEGDDHNLAVNFSTAMARSIAFLDAHVKNN